jgi:hypothetical protein
MRLRSGGIDIFYIDESNDGQLYVITCVAVPFMRPADGGWNIVWADYLDRAKDRRRRIRRTFDIPMSKELHGVKLASGRGNYIKGKFNFVRPKAGAVYRSILASVDFVPDASIMTACAPRSARTLYGRARLESALHALFQRMRLQCLARNVNALVFFDAGHPEYRKLYRQAQIYLPTGSMFRMLGTKNLPLDMFTKDANEKDSKHCYFTQLADLVAYSAFIKMKGERGTLTPWQTQYAMSNLYDSLPTRLLNLRASSKAPRDGIVRLP